MKYSAAGTLALVLSTVACGDQPLVEPERSLEAGSPDMSIMGEIGPGASYEILVPDVWNGDLILYAHGYVDPAEPDPLTDMERTLLPLLPTLGYAVAWSSYSENGLAVKDAAQRTKQLRGVFNEAVGEPDRIYLAGGSMGGLVALDLIERFPRHYDGALALCGMVGGSQAQIDYVAHVRVLFDALFPGVLPGSLFESPPLTPAEVAALVGTAVATDPSVPPRASVLANVMVSTFSTPVPATDAGQLVTSLVAALAFDVRGFEDVLSRTHGHVSFDNSDVWYTGSPDDAGLNGVVQRYEATPDARSYLERYYLPSGALRVPVLTLHNMLDPLVPAFHEGLLASSALSAGYADQLVQWPAEEPYGHCDFDTEEILEAFGALVAWVEFGVPPGTP